jgi:hypothetical protein
LALIEDQEKAIRLARAIASDISLYNDVKIKEGIERDNLFEFLSKEFQEGCDLYKGRVSAKLDPDFYFYWCAIVNVVVKARAHMAAKIWL